MANSSPVKKWFKRISVVVLSLFLLAGVAAGSAWWYWHPSHQRTDGVVYGQRGDQKLTMDIIRPSSPNGLAVALMVSGGWRSQMPGEFPTWMMAPVLRSGYTVFAICHVSQPEASVQEIVADMKRGIRYIRQNAEQYGIDPNRIGVTGGSVGGHLSLMLATRGDPGDPHATDEIDRYSSQVQAVAIFYPVTDLVDLGDSTENLRDGGPPKSFVNSFGPDGQDLQKWPDIARDLSPLHFVSQSLPPTLIYHGDADTLVPLDQSIRFRDRAQQLQRPVQVVVHSGGGHGWLTMPWDIRAFANWFDQHLQD